MLFFEIEARNSKNDEVITKEAFSYEKAINMANEMSRDGFVVTLRPLHDQNEGVVKAATQKHVRSAHSFIERENVKLKPVVITRGEHSYTVPIEMLTKSGNLKRTVRKLVDAYFEKVTATA